MRGLKKRRRIQLVFLASGLIAAAAVLAGYGLRDGIAYFRLPADIASDMPHENEIFRLGGLVAAGSVTMRDDGVEFYVSDGEHAVPVRYSGILPDLFAENQGVIVLGSYRDKTFFASEVLAKHDETYMPKEVADALKERGLFQPSGE